LEKIMAIATQLTDKALKNLVEDITGGNIVSSSATEVVINLIYSEDPQADSITLTGTGLAVSAGALSAGTITSFQFTDNASALATITGISLSFGDFNSMLTNGAMFETYIEFLLGDDNPGGSGGVSDIGDSGDDSMSGSSDDDYLRGGSGDDEVHGGHGADDLYGDDGDDHIHGGSGKDYIDGGTGDDTVHYEDSVKVTVNLARGQASDSSGRDKLVNIENVVGSSGNDSITGDDSGNHLRGDDGNDKLSGGGGDDVLESGNGDDKISGGSGDDNLVGGSGKDHMSGGSGDDAYDVDQSDDKVTEGANQGDDTVTAHDDYVLGRNIETLILAEDGGNINGTGNKGNDTLIGNSGDNVLDGGKGGSDSLTGGLGEDTFVLASKPANGVFDTITDFTSGEDLIQLSEKIFKALDDNTLADDFISYDNGSVPVANDGHHLLYNSDTGALYYDADGSGAKGAMQIALLGEDSRPTPAPTPGRRRWAEPGELRVDQCRRRRGECARRSLVPHSSHSRRRWRFLPLFWGRP
jgi:Ca2+-binding RTX toxin-like protein